LPKNKSQARPSTINGGRRWAKQTSEYLGCTERALCVEPEVAELYDKTRIDLSMLPAIMTAEELAGAIRSSVGALAQDRYLRRGIPYLKLGRRVRYVRAEVARYLLAAHS
jgi:hypothetical protein